MKVVFITGDVLACALLLAFLVSFLVAFLVAFLLPFLLAFALTGLFVVVRGVGIRDICGVKWLSWSALPLSHYCRILVAQRTVLLHGALQKRPREG